MKRIVCGMIFISMFLCCCIFVSANKNNEYWKFTINNVDGLVDECVICENDTGEVMLPFRFLMESLGATVIWDSKSGDILLDFKSEKWLIEDLSEVWSKDNVKSVYLRNLQITAEQAENVVGYSEVSGYYITAEGVSFDYGMVLIDDKNYVYIEDLEKLLKVFRGKLTIDQDSRIVNVFIKPKPFYPGNAFVRDNIELHDGNTNLSIPVLTWNGTLKAISLDGFMVAMGANRVEAYDEYIENRQCLAGYEPEYYKVFELNGNTLICSYDKSTYEYLQLSDGRTEGIFSYTIRNTSKEGKNTLCFVKQGLSNETLYSGNGVNGTACAIDGEIYMYVNSAEHMLKYCGYKIIETDGNISIEKTTNAIDESLHHFIYR